MSVPRIFIIAGRPSLVEFRKLTGETPGFYKSVEISRIVALPEISKNSLLTGVADIQSTGFKTTKIKLLAKPFKDILKISENL